jgi:hypothetical protein
MSLTSYRAAPPRATICVSVCLRTRLFRENKGPHDAALAANSGGQSKREDKRAFCRPGSDLLSRVLRRSTISAGTFHGRVRNGIGCSRSAITTRSAKRTLFEKLFFRANHRGHISPSENTPPNAMGTENENDQADRAISTGKLHALPHFHTRPINVVVFHDSQGILVLRWVSRLDAFSGYPVRI